MTSPEFWSLGAGPHHCITSFCRRRHRASRGMKGVLLSPHHPFRGPGSVVSSPVGSKMGFMHIWGDQKEATRNIFFSIFERRRPPSQTLRDPEKLPSHLDGPASFQSIRRKGGKFDYRTGRPKVLLRHCASATSSVFVIE